MTKVALERKAERNHYGEPPSAVVTAAYPWWRSRQGFLVHRPRYGTLHFRPPHEGRGWLSFTWYCGNQTCQPVPVDPADKLAHKLVVCQVCVIKAVTITADEAATRLADVMAAMQRLDA